MRTMRFICDECGKEASMTLPLPDHVSRPAGWILIDSNLTTVANGSAIEVCSLECTSMHLRKQGTIHKITLSVSLR